MEISILECDWGEAKRGDLRKLLTNTASCFSEHMRSPFNGSIEVVNLPEEEYLRVFYRNPDNCGYKINLIA